MTVVELIEYLQTNCDPGDNVAAILGRSSFTYSRAHVSVMKDQCNLVCLLDVADVGAKKMQFDYLTFR